MVTPMTDVQMMGLMAAMIESGQRALPEEQRTPANLVVVKAFELMAEVVTLKDTPLYRTFRAHMRKREGLDEPGHGEQEKPSNLVAGGDA
jgi:hypothetical protein